MANLATFRCAAGLDDAAATPEASALVAAVVASATGILCFDISHPWGWIGIYTSGYGAARQAVRALTVTMAGLLAGHVTQVARDRARAPRVTGALLSGRARCAMADRAEASAKRLRAPPGRRS